MKKPKIPLDVLIGLVLLMVVGTAFAAYWIYSNTVIVQVSAFTFKDSLTVDIPTPTQYKNITFTGTLYYGESHVGAGYNITLFKNEIPVAWNTTDTNGNFIIVYNATAIGTFDFKVGYEVP